LAAGVELAEVSMPLGRSELRVTMEFYAHLQKAGCSEGAQRVDVLFGG
jgi:hypothetical protein